MLIQRARLLDGTRGRHPCRATNRRRGRTPHPGRGRGGVRRGRARRHPRPARPPRPPAFRGRGTDVGVRGTARGARPCRPGPRTVRGHRRRGWLDQGRGLPRSRRGAAGPHGPGRGVTRRAGARATPQWGAVDAQLVRAGQGRAARPPRRPAAQRRPELVERLAAPRNRARRGEPTAGVLRRHRRHRGHPRSRRGRRGEVRRGASSRGPSAIGDVPGAGQADPARRRARPRRADHVDRCDVTKRTEWSPCTASPLPSSSSPSPHSTRRVRGRGTASSMPPSCPTTALPIWPGSACWS